MMALSGWGMGVCLFVAGGCVFMYVCIGEDGGTEVYLQEKGSLHRGAWRADLLALDPGEVLGCDGG